MIQKLIFCLVFLFVVQCSNAQNLGFSLTEGQTKVRIPIEICNNLIVVPVVLNGTLPLKFILDTGVRTSILTEKAFSDFLHLTYARKYTIAGPGGEKFIDAYITNNVTIDIPGVHGEGHAMLVLDQDYLELRNYLGTDVHGILGYELFSRFIVQIDYASKILTLMHPDHFKPQKKSDKINIHVIDTKPYMFAEVGMPGNLHFPVTLLIDTGASHGLLLDPASDATMVVPDKHIKSIIGRGLGGVITGKIARIHNVRVGHNTMPGVIVNFPDPDSYSDTLKNSSSAFRNGTLGGEILSRFTVTFDFPHEKMYLKRNQNYRKEFHYNMSGLTIKAFGEKLRNFEVTDVRDHSVSEAADIKVGDRILSFNGVPANELTLDNTDDILNSRPGKRVLLEIVREGKKIKREFFLQDQI